MNAEAAGAEELWQFVQVDEYRVPESGVDRVRKGFLNVLSSLRRGRKQARSESPLDPEQDLRRLPDERLELAVPEPDWDDASELLQQRLDPWLRTTSPEKPVVFYVAPPFSGREELLLRWSSRYDVAIADEPQRERILSGDAEWFGSWPTAELWLLPRLEKCFLRSAEGLDLVRELLARVLSGEMGRGIIGCDSWAWSFLRHVWLGRPSFTITAQAFDARRMKSLFSRSIRRSGMPCERFRQADNGAYLLGTAEPGGRTEPGGPEPFWRRLAAFSRGNIGVASAYWRRALRSIPEKDLKDREADARQSRDMVWVTPWEGLERPAFPSQAGETARFVLHALLVHGGLEEGPLADILPGDRAAITEALLYLAETRLVEERDEGWRVTPWGYPAVRGTLAADDYLCDSF